MDRSKWEYKKLGEFTSIRTGKLDANAADVNGVYPFFTCSKEPLSINSYSYDCECLLIAGNGDLNVKYYKGKFDAYQRTYIIQLKNDVEGIDMHYLYLFFSKYIEILRKKSIGGVIKYIKLGDLTEAIVPIYSITDQQRIVAELDCLNEMIALKQEQLKEFDKLAQSIFYDMFGDPGDNVHEWEISILEDVVSENCSISYGIVQPGDDVENGVPVVRPVDLVNQIVYRDGLKIVDKAISDSYKRTILNGDELLFCVRGTTGIISFASEELEGCNVTRGITPLEFADRIDKYYAYYLLKTPYLQSLIAEKTNGIALKQINMRDVRLLPIMCPPLALQHQFAEKIQAIEAQKELVKKSIAETQHLLDSRMDYYFD